MPTRSKKLLQIRQHRSALEWWTYQHHKHPLGLVPIPTAARMLGVSTRRVRSLIQDGRLDVVEGMPGGNSRDRFIPGVQLINAPFALNRGRPGQWGGSRSPNSRRQYP